MELCLLTEAQKETVRSSRYEYSEQDVVELAFLSHSISVLARCMIVYHLYEKKDQCDDAHIYGILELLIKPINDFLSEGAPMKGETDEDRQEGADNEKC